MEKLKRYYWKRQIVSMERLEYILLEISKDITENVTNIIGKLKRYQ